MHKEIKCTVPHLFPKPVFNCNAWLLQVNDQIFFSAAHGGRIIVNKKPGQAYYNGSAANGIESQNFGSYRSSFVVEGTKLYFFGHSNFQTVTAASNELAFIELLLEMLVQNKRIKIEDWTVSECTYTLMTVVIYIYNVQKPLSEVASLLCCTS